MDFFNQFLNEYVPTLLYTIITSIISYVGLKLQKSYDNYLNEKLKKDNADTVCHAINQLYKGLSGEEKLIKATEALKTIFTEKNIKITDLELRLLIESSVHCSKLNSS